MAELKREFNSTNEIGDPGEPTDPALKEVDINIEAKIRGIHEDLSAALIAQGVPQERITKGDIRPQSVLYMAYWFGRLRNNPEEQSHIRQNLIEYIGTAAADPAAIADALFSNKILCESAKEYAETLLVPVRTVDLVITKTGAAGGKEVLCSKRGYYPFGLALPGGIIKDQDEDNDLGLPAHEFAALRVAGEKVLGLGDKAQYSRKTDERGKAYFLIRGDEELPAVRLYAEDQGGYHYRENIKAVLRPSDPRHIVDTIGFTCQLEGDPAGALEWKNKSTIMSPDEPTGGFAFGHHREIVAYISSQTSVEKEREMEDREFIRFIIKEPLKAYRSL